jgi:hypothetical protein
MNCHKDTKAQNKNEFITVWCLGAFVAKKTGSKK